MNMSDNDPQASASSDPPIIVHGGSVRVDVPAGFIDEGGKKFKNDKVTLDTLQINEDTPIPLNKGDRITITYK
jgi:hypothetical protein